MSLFCFLWFQIGASKLLGASTLIKGSRPLLGSSDSSYQYGRVPEYILERKKEWEKEATRIQLEVEEQQKQQDKEFYQLSDEEARELKEKLKAKWAELNHVFQLTAHKPNLFNSESHQKRRENLEREMDYLTKCIERVNKERIFIDEKNEYPALV